MAGIIKFMCVVCVSLLIGLTLACGLAVLVNAVSPSFNGMDWAVVMQAIAR